MSMLTILRAYTIYIQIISLLNKFEGIHALVYTAQQHNQEVILSLWVKFIYLTDFNLGDKSLFFTLNIMKIL